MGDSPAHRMDSAHRKGAWCAVQQTEPPSPYTAHGPFAVAELKLDFIVRFFDARDEVLALGVASRRLKGCEFHLVQ